MYSCSKCKLAVIVLDDKVIKACKCEAPITCEMEAVASGKSSMNL